ncbi:MAG TPA: cupin domain-containing protein [Candidatus Binataceae bacterium]|nr:cupin domain-containing protein [Candidatus Binataceae bacterium]
MIDIEKTRRIVTGFDETGKSMVAIDGPPGSIVGANGAGIAEVWVTDGIADNSIRGDLAKRPVILEPPDGGSVCRFFAVDPEVTGLSAKEMEEGAAAAFKAIGGEHCRPDTTRAPGMHTTRTIDYVVLLEGEITLILETGEVTLKPYDVVVQRGTNHAWANRGKKRALLMAVLIDAKPLPGKSGLQR